MTINPKDDYNTLGSLFYPSIEASGNVYYGQTRKLAIDELFNTNNGGFSQCVLPRPLRSGSKYFSWELGPLKGCLKVFNDFYDSDNIYFAKYNIKVKNNEPVIYDVIDSGQFPTYSKSVYIELDKDQPYVIGAVNPVTINDPEKAEAWDGRNFYVDVDKKILYIAIAKDSLKKEITKAMTYPSQEELEQPLTFENIGRYEPTYIRLYKDNVEENANSYEYRTISNDGSISEWKQQTSYAKPFENDVANVFYGLEDELDVDGSIRLRPGCKVQYRLVGEYSRPNPSSTARFITLQRPLLTGDEPNILLSGNIASMIAQEPEVFSTIKDNSNYPYGHDRMFEECYYIKSARNLIIPYETLGSGITGLFNRCESLVYAPYIYVKKLVRFSVLPFVTDKSHGMNYCFNQCISLVEPPPILPLIDYTSADVIYAYTCMFKNCSSINKPPLIPLVKCTFDVLESMFKNCSKLTQMPVILSNDLNNLFNSDRLVNENKSFHNTFIGTQIEAIYCAATSDSSPSSKPKFSEWLPNSVQKIYVPSNYPDNFWESVDDANYREKITKIDTVMDTNEYPQYWIKSESEDLLLVDGLWLTKDNFGYPTVLSTSHLSLTAIEKDVGIVFDVGSTTPLIISDGDIFIAGEVHINGDIERCMSLTSDDVYCSTLEATTIYVDEEYHNACISKIPFNDDVDQNICMYSKQNIYNDSVSVGFVATGSDYDSRSGDFSLSSAIGSHLAVEKGRLSVFDESNNLENIGCAVICKTEGNYKSDSCYSSIMLTAGDPSINSIEVSTENGIQIKSNRITVGGTETAELRVLGNTFPDKDKTYDLGSKTLKFNNVYANKLNGAWIEIFPEYPSLYDNATLTFGENGIMTNKDIVPADTLSNIQSCGRISRPWKELYVKDAIHLTTGSDDFLIYEDDGSIEFLNKYTSGGSQGEFFFDKIALGGRTERASIHCGEIYGAPMDTFKAVENTSEDMRTHQFSVPVGAIILAIPPSSFLTNPARSRVNVGEIITIAANTWYAAEWNPGDTTQTSTWLRGSYYSEAYWRSSDYVYLPAGKYRACHSIASVNSLHTHTKGTPIMLQRWS